MTFFKKLFSYFFVFIILFFISKEPAVATETIHSPIFSTAGFFELPQTGRTVYSMNQSWRFYKGDLKFAPVDVAFDDSQWETVALPHGIEYLPVDASGCVNYQGVVWYRKHFQPISQWKGKKLFIHFEAIMGKSKFWINGKPVTSHWGGYLPVIADITDYVDWEHENVITVCADNSDDPTYPVGKKQSLLDFAYFGGIYRDCWLVAHNKVYITDANYENVIGGGGLFVSYNHVSEQQAEILIRTHIRNSTLKQESVNVTAELRMLTGSVVRKTTVKSSIHAGEAVENEQKMVVDHPALWSPEHPNLYYLDVYVKDRKGNVLDGYRQRIGIRSIEFKKEQGLWLNGKPYPGKIMGTNRHQDFAILGNAVPNNLQWRDVKKLRDAGMKVCRTHYVLDPAFMDACDELGLFCLVATPGWQFWNPEEIFAQRIYGDIRNMIRLHRNHACMFFLEPILNETDYPLDFAKNARKICDEEYPYPYCIAACDDGAVGNQFFDLQLRPRLDKLIPDKTYFVREYGDNVDDWNAQNSNSRVARNWGEIPMLIQARHYEQWYDKILRYPNQVVGGCFWNAIDCQRGYHTDPFWGGMLDAFRQPKTSYYMFMSQREKEENASGAGPMIYIAHDMTPFSPEDVTVFSNCDEVRLSIFENGSKRILPQTATNGVVSHTFVFNKAFDFMKTKALARAGKQNQCYLLAEGLIDGKVVASDKRFPAGQSNHIRLRIDNCNVPLVADGSDIVTVIAEIVDKRGIVKRLNNDRVRFSIEGEGRLIGDETIGANPSPIVWGSAPILVQSTNKAGKIKVMASICYPGACRPTSGYIEFESVPNNMREIVDSPDWIKVQNLSPKMNHQAESSSSSCEELRMENEQLRRQLNDLRIKQVEQQQTKFGAGLND